MDLSLGLISLTITLFFIVISQKIFVKKSIIDKIKLRSSHTTLATRSGGIAIFSTLFLVSIYYYLAGKDIYDLSFLIHFKFIFQVVAAKIIIDNGLIIDNLHGVFGIYEIGRITAQLLTMFIIVAIINAINFIDGIDGLAITAIIFFIVLFEFFADTTSPFFILSHIIVFSLLPLYYFNYRKNNKVFLGDSGSLFLGSLVSIYVVYILNNNYIIKESYDLNKVIYVFSILTYPIIDISRVVLIRIYNKKSPFLPDKNHIHHIIVSKFQSHRLTVLTIYLVNILVLVILQLIF